MKNTLVEASNGTISTDSLIPTIIIPAQENKHDIARAFSGVLKQRNDNETVLDHKKRKNTVPTSPTFNSISSKPLCACGTNQWSVSEICIAAGLVVNQKAT